MTRQWVCHAHRRVAANLSPRQREILELVAKGRTSKQIASELGISESTVNWHIANAFTRLGAGSRAEAVTLAFRGDQEREQGNGAAPVAPAPRPVRGPALADLPPRFLAIVIAVAIAAALLGAATVAAFRVGAPPAGATPSPGSRATPGDSALAASEPVVPSGAAAPPAERAADPLIVRTP
jgi:DNA-binding CsgD family transcriptional regulator